MWNTFSFSFGRGKPLKAAQERPLPVVLNGPVRQSGNSFSNLLRKLIRENPSRCVMYQYGLPNSVRKGLQPMRLSKLMLTATLLVGGLLAAPPIASAWAFYWSKVEVHTTSWKTCMSYANDSARAQHLAQIKQTNLDVTGTRNGANATITCIGTGANSKAMAVVMVVGDANEPVKQLRDDLVTSITRIVTID